MRILKKHANAALWLIDDNPICTASLRAKAKEAGVQDQLIFGSRAPYGEFVGRLSLADICLDSFPYNCGSTARDIVHAGVPYVSLAGNTMVSRMGASVLHALHLSDYVVSSATSYESLVGTLLKGDVTRRSIGEHMKSRIFGWRDMVVRSVHSIERQMHVMGS
jgi:predicted O-linked N-acetylglucosamine transferase (SPINDLY family)